MKRIISEIVAAVVMVGATVVVAGAMMAGLTIVANASWSPWSAKRADAAATFSLDPVAVECRRAPATWPGCIGPPGRPYADRLCRRDDGWVSWWANGDETEEEAMAMYRNILDWNEEQQRWEQE